MKRGVFMTDSNKEGLGLCIREILVFKLKDLMEKESRFTKMGLFLKDIFLMDLICLILKLERKSIGSTWI